MNYTPRLILEKLHGLGLDVSATGDHVHLAGDAAPPPDLLDALREQKAGVLTLLDSMPVFSVDAVRRLISAYSAATRETRLQIHRRGMALRRDRQWPFYAADLAAIQEHFEPHEAR